MIPRKKTTELKHYKHLTRRLTLAFFATIFVMLLLSVLIMFLLERLGVNFRSGIFSAYGSLSIYVISVILASAISYFAVWNIFRPLSDLSKGTRKIAEGDYSVRLEYKGRLSELAESVENFNYMAQELGSIEMIRNDFIANVSHEFKTPLSSLSGYLTLLQDGSLSDAERSEYISKAFFSIEKLNDLTDNILRLSKLENQVAMDEPTSFRLDEQLREAIVLLEPKWSRRNISFDLALPELTVSGQRSLLFQVWTNLLSNAIKFSDEGSSVTVKIEESPHHYKVYISDTGIGMSEEQQRHIFDKFYQADSSRQAQGNGLGLALCKEIVAKCGGKIYVTSKLGEGSVFLVSLRKNSGED
ncbi:MAG: HAMP domain-containing sensor histidine kinase [Ruminococcus sp.]|nr:HAMP domain-containing sensor histidine kinase [Ruminococcus sp.]